MSIESDKNDDVAPKPAQVNLAEVQEIKVTDLSADSIRAAALWASPPETQNTSDPELNSKGQTSPQFQAQRSVQHTGPSATTENNASAGQSRSNDVGVNTAADSNASLEQIGLSFIQEQRRARNWKIFFRFLWIALFIWFLYRITSGGASVAPSGLSQDHTAVVSIEDTIASDSMASSHYVIPALQSAFEANSAKAVVLLINSPGGSPVQAGIIYDEVKRLKAKHKKPVYAVVQESATSAAYYIAVAADDIYVDKASIVGSIGVLMDGFGATELMKKLGVERRLLTAGERKGILDPFSPQSEDDVAYAHKLLDQIHQQFIAVVREGRKGRLKESADTFSGLFWTGQEAVALGLVDKIGSLEFVAREVVKAEELVNYSYEEGVAERLVKRFGAAIGHAVVQSATPSLKVQ